MKYSFTSNGKRLRYAAALFTALVMISASALPAFAANTLYENRQTKQLARGVTYERNRMMTDAGLMDVHVLLVPLSESITIEPVDSSKDLGLKESTSSLIKSSGAIAGTNGDFFGLSGTYSIPFGPVIAGGELKAVSDYTNTYGNEFAAFMLDFNNNPVMKYFKSVIHFRNNGAENIEISAYNKTGNTFEWPVIIDRAYLRNTMSLDKRFPGLTKVSVSGGKITHISGKGETVEVPQDGFVVIIPPQFYDRYIPKVHVGDAAAMQVTNNINLDFDTIRSAIGGGGLILQNGTTVHDTGTAIGGRQPRTAVGVSADRKTLVMMTVDGRGQSVGATHDEMAGLLKRYGASDAMHLDGGGSTTMVYQDPNSGKYNVANRVSDGSERRIINALGIFDRAPVGPMKKIAVQAHQEHTFIDGPVGMQVFGEDEYGHRIGLVQEAESEWKSVNQRLEGEGRFVGTILTDTIPLPFEDDLLHHGGPMNEEPPFQKEPSDYMVYSVPGDGDQNGSENKNTEPSGGGYATPQGELNFSTLSDRNAGKWSGNVYTPSTPGEHLLEVGYGDFKATKSIQVHEIAELRSDPSSIVLLEGMSQELSFTGIATDGTEVPADNAVSISVVPPELGKVEDKLEASGSRENRFTALRAGSGYLDCAVGDVHTYVPVSVSGYGQLLNLFGGDSPISFTGYPETVTGEVERVSAGIRDITGMTYTFKQSQDTQAAYLNLDSRAMLPGEPIALRMRVYGDNSGNWLRGRVTDANDNSYAIDFAQAIDFEGWETVTAMLPREVVYPVSLDRVYAVALTCDENQTHTLYFDMLEALYKPTVVAAVPEGKKYDDPFKADLSSLSGSPGVYDFTVPLKAEYSSAKFENIALVTLAASEGGLYSTDPSQWSRLPRDIAGLSPDFVVVLLDISPSDFESRMEAELLHQALLEQTRSGRKVFVVSAAGAGSPSVTLMDGIRYIELAAPLEGREAGIRFRVDGKNIWFDTNR